MNRDEALFYEALEHGTPAAAADFLDRACAGEPELRERVERLLAAHGGPDSLLDQPANVAVATCDISPAISERAGHQIGPYKLIQQIGEGGMGVVYMAQQTEPVKRLVALKIIKPGMDSRQVIARFEAERQALALMDHPNIAKVLDAGTTGVGGQESGVEKARELMPTPDPRFLTPSAAKPFFVMELVKGIPITTYCDEKQLSPRERLKLFIPVCLAVQHAHQKGIIHRDLKPSNVLIALYDGQPVPKVIDFGVAKATGGQLTEKTLVTNFGSLVGTVEYMSPEQAELNQLDVDTRSDIYSLGVMLYELLTGGTPLDRQRLRSVAFGEMLRLIREEEPETVSARLARTKSNRHTPSAVAARVAPGREVNHGVSSDFNPKSKIQNLKSSELDWIVMKSLEKDRSRRYESASAFAADIQRCLSDEPVLACPPTAMYRFQKFARKHKPALITAASIALCLLLGTTVSAWQAVRATSAEAQAETNAQKADEKAKEATKERDEAQKQHDEIKALADKLAAKEEELQRTLYADHMHMAKAAWDSGNVNDLARLLAQHRAKDGELDRRGFEWHYLNRLANIGPHLSISTPRLLPEHLTISADRTRLIRFSPAMLPPGPRNGAMRANPPTLQAWNLQTGQEVLTAELSGVPDRTGATSRRQAMPKFTPDGAHLVLNNGSFDNLAGVYVPGDLKIWETRTGKEILKLSGVIAGVWFSPDNKLLAIAMEDQSVKLWDLQTGQERLTLQGQLKVPNSIAFSPDGKRLATAGDNKWDNAKNTYAGGEIRIWNIETGEQLKSFKGQEGWMNLVYSPDGQRLLTSAEENSEIKLWDPHTGSELATFRWDTGSAYAVSFNADGTRLIARCYKKGEEENSVVSYGMLWNAQTGRELLSLNADELQFSPDGKRVAMSDWASSRTKVFDAQSGQIMLSVKEAGGKLAFSPDSKRFATQSGGMRIWDLETGDEINHIKGFRGDHLLAFNQDGKRLIGSIFSATQVWDAEIEQKSAQKLTLNGVHRNSPHTMGDSPAVFSSDFTRLAGISYKTVKLFDVPGGHELRTFTGPEENVLCVAISPDCKRVAAADGKRGESGRPTSSVVRVWDAVTGDELRKISVPDHAIAHLVFSPDGKKLAGSSRDNTAKVWDAQSGDELFPIGSNRQGRTPGSTTMIGLDFSPDSSRLAFNGKILDAQTGKVLVVLEDGTGCIAFSSDGKRVLGGSLRKGYAVFDAESGDQLFSVPVVGLGSSAAFSRDGKRLASSTKMWDAQTGQELLSLSQDLGSAGNNISGQVAFSPDGNRLAVVKAFGNEVTIYDATPLANP